MMVVFYIGLGGSSVAAGFASTPGALLPGLTFGLSLRAVAVLSVMLVPCPISSHRFRAPTDIAGANICVATLK